jgi:hypothetical protein
MPSTKIGLKLGIALTGLLMSSELAHAQWTKVNNPPSGTNPSTCLLLTDGTVMCQANEQNKSWLRLTPDNTGSYENGTWTALTDAPQGTDTSVASGPPPAPQVSGPCNPCQYAPLYYASAVLPDGRVVIIGGEDNTNGNTWTNIGFLFDPTGNGGLGSWSAQLSEPFGTGNIGDAQSVILPNGTMLVANINNSNLASFNPSTLAFTALNPTGKSDRNDEEGWTLLPSGKILAVDTTTQNTSEIYDPATNTWGNQANTAGIDLADIGGNCNSQELGPAVSRPDGTVVQFSGNSTGQNAVYTISNNTWALGPTFKNANESVSDGPAALLVNGNVLVQASPACVLTSPGPPAVYTNFNTPSRFYEFDGTNLNEVTPSSPSSNGPNTPALASFYGRMLVLPSGRILFTHRGDATDVWTYTPTGGPQSAWRPAITSAQSVLGVGQSYSISGTMFNGFSQGAAYGDDAQTATNFPLVRITNNGSGHVVYARTHDPSSMGVEAVGSSTVVSTNFDVPSGLELGASTLVVVTNGIPSVPMNVAVELGSSLAFTAGSATSADFNDAATVQTKLLSAGGPLAGKQVTFVLGSGSGTETCSATTDASGLATCSITPNQAAGGYTLTGTFPGDATYAASSAVTGFIILHEQTAIAFTGASATNADYDDAATVQAQLTTDGAPLANELVTISLGSGSGTETCTSTTNAGGIATCQITPNQQAGSYTVAATFAGDPFYAASSIAAPFTINKEETTTKFTLGSPTVIANGHSTTFSATLLEDGLIPIQGRTLTITIGSQSCLTGSTDSTGTASCAILINQTLGPGSVKASFAGDGFYLASTVSEAVIVFAFLNSGSMIVGNLNAAVNAEVTFWAAQWSRVNSLSGGSAPDAFKGFASTAPQACGGTWTSAPGNSSGPPSGPLPSYMGVIASSTIIKSGSNIVGDVPIIIVVKTNSGYGPSPGHSGTGTVVAFFCH